jgi:hypothetical protein
MGREPAILQNGEAIPDVQAHPRRLSHRGPGSAQGAAALYPRFRRPAAVPLSGMRHEVAVALAGLYAAEAPMLLRGVNPERERRQQRELHGDTQKPQEETAATHERIVAPPGVIRSSSSFYTSRPSPVQRVTEAKAAGPLQVHHPSELQPGPVTAIPREGARVDDSPYFIRAVGSAVSQGDQRLTCLLGTLGDCQCGASRPCIRIYSTIPMSGFLEWPAVQYPRGGGPPPPEAMVREERCLRSSALT